MSLTLIPESDIYVGPALAGGSRDFTISACKTEHYRRLGWVHGDDVRYHRDYIYKLDPGHRWLSINWVDGPAKLFDWSGELGIWPLAFDLLDEWRDAGLKPKVVCDKGLSRSPTLVMAYLAKRTDILPDEFVPAACAFTHLYPAWKPNTTGICGWVRDHWDDLDPTCTTTHQQKESS